VAFPYLQIFGNLVTMTEIFAEIRHFYPLCLKQYSGLDLDNKHYLKNDVLTVWPLTLWAMDMPFKALSIT
jgi:hypothetical protein